MDDGTDVGDAKSLSIAADDMHGSLTLSPQAASKADLDPADAPVVKATMSQGQDPGDGTVPEWSAAHQLRSGKFKAVFCQEGYDHQGSYGNDSALSSTLYCLVRIIQDMEWSR